jgi:hypothetical protein
MSATGMPEKFQFGSGRKKDASLFLDCFRGATKYREHWNKWIVDECWIVIINKRRCDMPESVQFTAAELNRAMSGNAMFKAAGVDAVTLANALGICKSSCRPNGHAKRVTGCCVTTPGMKPSEMPGGNSKWHAPIVNEIPIERDVHAQRHLQCPNEMQICESCFACSLGRHAGEEMDGMLRAGCERIGWDAWRDMTTVRPHHRNPGPGLSNPF